MSRVIESLSSDPGILLGAILGSLAMLSVATVLVAAFVTHAWRKVRQTEDNNALKHALLSQGMSAEEITAVVMAWPGRRSSASGERGWRRHQRCAERTDMASRT